MSGNQPGISRRAVLATSSVTLSAAALALKAGAPFSGTARTVPFHGSHQAGITTPTQDHLVFATFDVVGSRDDLQGLLSTWGTVAPILAEGRPIPAVWDSTYPPSDTGEATGLAPSGLTLTFGYGPSLFDARFGLSRRQPGVLQPVPILPGDALDPATSNGDLCIQACADDPMVAFHAVRNLTLLGQGTVVLRALQIGTGRTSTTSSSQPTERNLLGFKDGTNNLTGSDTALLKRWVWVDSGDDQPWMGGGSYLVARRLRLDLEAWSSLPLTDQEQVIGRFRASGAPLTGTTEHDAPDLAAQGPHGDPIIPANSHIRIAAPTTNNGIHLLRRGYNFIDGLDPTTGAYDAGLFFICFQRDPMAQFATLAGDLARTDALMRYVTATTSAVFACPPGLEKGQTLGADLFA